MHPHAWKVRGFAAARTAPWPARKSGRLRAEPCASNTGSNRRRRSRGTMAATERMKRIPAFVRGMVVKAVEDSCRKNGIDRVTVEELERIRARMPTPKIFG